MRRTVKVGVLVMLLVSLLVASVSANSVVIPLPKITAKFDVQPVPRLLGKAYQPIGLRLGGSFETKDGSQVPALRSFDVEYAEGLALSGRSSLPKCGRSVLHADPTRCSASLIGRGVGRIDKGSTEEAVRLAAYLSGSARDSLRILIAVQPKTGEREKAVVSSMSIISDGRELHAVWSIPQIRKGYASLVDFTLNLRRFIFHQGKREVLLLGRCPKDDLQAHVKAQLRDEVESGIGDQQVDASVVGACNGS